MKTLLALVLLSATAFAQNQPSCSSFEKTQEAVLNAVRTINTIEVTYKFQVSKTGSYATMDELMHSAPMKAWLEEQKSMPGDFLRLHSTGDPLPGYDVTFVLSTGGQHYSLSILKKKGGDCALVGLSSSDAGIIYRTMPIDYEAPTTAALK